MNCPRCQRENRPDAKLCDTCGTPLNGAAPLARSYTELTAEIDTLRRSLNEALEQQTATSEILRVISNSPTDVQPVLEMIAQRSGEVCDGFFCVVFMVQGDHLHLRASHNIPTSISSVFASVYPAPLTSPLRSVQAVREGRAIAVADMQDEAGAPPGLAERSRAYGLRSWVAVPMMRGGRGIGAIAVGRREMRPFSEKDIALLQTFAAQAVIAIENVRLFTETKEALERQTATSEILRVISSSPTDAEPVFRTILANANALCDARFSVLWLWDGEALTARAHENVSSAMAEHLRTARPRPHRGTPLGLCLLEQAVVHVPDVASDPRFKPEDVPTYRLDDARSTMSAPMIREGRLVGVINIWRREPRAFTGVQIELLKTFADQAVIAIDNVRLFKELRSSNRELTTALDTQTATSEVLRVISSSLTDIAPVFDAILRSAVRLSDSIFGVAIRYDGQLMHLMAHYNQTPEGPAVLQETYPAPLSVGTPSAQAIERREPVRVENAAQEGRGQERTAAIARAVGNRATLSVPMLREGQPIGAITLERGEPGSYSLEHVALLQTFAEQAVIAIENVRLFKELETRNRDLSEALEQQTATAEILRVISSSPSDAQPVFETIARSAVRLCDGVISAVFRLESGQIHHAAAHGPDPAVLEADRRRFPLPMVERDSLVARAMAQRAVLETPDVEDASMTEMTVTREAGRALGFRSELAVPMLRGDEVIGAVAVNRREPGRFTATQIVLLKTFADQAVIAIENARLFTELQEKNRALTQAHAQVSEALERQTATADILRVISVSQAEVQPVFDTIVDNAMRLFRAWAAAIYQSDGKLAHLIAARGGLPGSEQQLPAHWPIDETSPGGRCIAHRTVVHIPDADSDPALDPAIQRVARMRGWRSVLAAPIMRDEQPIGSITVTRAEAGSFSPAEVELLQTFAAQAVIAIENARLLTELRARTQQLTRSVEQLTALGEVGRAVSSTLDLETVLSTIVSRAIQLSGTEGGSVYEYDEATEEFSLRASRDLPAAYVEEVRDVRPRKGEGAVGRVAQTREPVQIVDISDATAYESRVRHTLLQIGLRALLAVPLIAEDQLVGALIVMRRRTGAFADEEVALLQTFATQSALAIQNARLFREIEEKSRQLEAASQHKSEFLANMSHELRTPLNAIIGFSEVLAERMFGELNEKQDEYLKDIHASGQHLLSLINDILDLSKIEAGRMELELTDFDLPAAIDNALTLVRERAGRHGIALRHEVDARLGQIRGDERKLKQVLLNLLSNAIKFTLEGGRIDVRAALVDGMAEVAVADTGVGIAAEDQETVFEEFRQVGTADKKVEGTGLGLTLCRKFVELHGGRIWVKSQVGAGSTFTFTIPIGR